MSADAHYVSVFMNVLGVYFFFQPHKNLEFHTVYLVCI